MSTPSAVTIASTRLHEPGASPPARPVRYDPIARGLHWSMAIGFLIVLGAAVAHWMAEDSALDQLLWPLHKPVGLLLLALGVVRASWAVIGSRRRPASTNRAAAWGHGVLYALMLAIPAIGLLRQYGSGRAFEPFGLPLMGARDGEPIAWMVDLGGALHGELGWVLLAGAAGHIAMVLWHRRQGQDVLPRMTG